MKKINKKKIILLIILIIMIIVEIKAFTDSRANKLLDITANIIDVSSLLKDEKYELKATSEGESGYSITLPNIVNNKKISKYFIERKDINNDITEDEIEQEEYQEKKPGEKLYLTGEEIENKETNIKAEYIKKEKDNKVLYDTVIEVKNSEIESSEKEEEKKEEKVVVTLSGYMPEDAEVKVKEIKQEEIEENIENYLDEKTTFQIAYDIKIISEEKEYEPEEFDENIDVKILGINNNLEYKVVHIDDEKNTNQIESVEKEKEDIKFTTNQFSTYVLLSEEQEEAGIENSQGENTENKVIEEISTFQSRSAIIKTEEPWDGTTVADSFAWGNGTESEPYLISDGEELAYLARQVTNGNTYEGKYFQIANNIDLGNQEWTPIGNNQNSFRGILDGAGHTIANARINVSNLPDRTYETYGIFGSIGGGSSRTIIRNVEFTNINIDISASGDTGSASIFSVNQDDEGIHIGIVSGAMYKSASIQNVIVTNSRIEDSNTINIIDSPFQLAIGGMVGYIANSYNNNSNPGTNNTYQIDNCYSETIIDIDATADVSNGGWFDPERDGRGQYHTGGIVGTIRGQAVWPTNCLYRGEINSNGFIGPIFGGLINNTDYSDSSTFQTIWNGNNAGTVAANNIYYSEYKAGGTTFTQTVTSGNSTARKSNTSSNIGYVQGVNKGIYTNNLNDIYNLFNNNVNEENKYVNWYYTNGTFSFKERLTTSVTEPVDFTYEIQITDEYNIGNYTHRWYKNGNEDTSIQGTTYVWTPNYLADEEMVVVTYDGSYYSIAKFVIKKIGVDIVFNINQSNDSVTAHLEGEGLKYTSVDDYTFQWYSEDIVGDTTLIENATSLTLNNLEEGLDYRLVATNTKIPQLSTENSFSYGERTVIYVKYSGGSDYNDGYTPDTPVKNLSTAYSKLDSNGSRNKNVIVIMGTYSSTSYMNSATSSTYSKNVTITGKYKGIDYDGTLYFYSGTSSYRYLTGDTTFQYLTFYGGRNQMYFYLQGHSLTIGEQVVMDNYANANSNQGLLGNNAPAFHIICGWLRYNYAKLPRNNAEVIIKSGTYGRIIGGGSPGTTGASNLEQTTSRNFMGSSMEDSFKLDITIDIKNSTTASEYDYDVNLLVGGSACGNNYSRVTENIKSGSVGRLLGGSIGDSSDKPSRWNYPINTFLGIVNINMTGGSIAELYGGCLGRNMDVVGSSSATGNMCDSYFYGTVNINIEDGVIEKNIYGAGAGGVSGYSTNSSDPYKSYGEEFNTSVNINISGGTINGNIYGGGYGYTEYLNANVTTEDAGSLYGDSNINITGTPIINGNIYAAGCGYNMSKRPNLAQMEGTSNIEISGTPTINGEIFGAGAGVSGYSEMAKLTGTANITLSSDLNTAVYGGGNIAKAEGTTNINIQSGNHTGDIYGGGNLGIITGNTNVNINGGTSERVFGGGNQATATSSTVNINGGNTNEVYAGGNSASVDTTNVFIKGGNTTTVYGGSNQTGNVQKSNIETTSGTVTTIFGGNNIGGKTEETNIVVNGGNITDSVYGGGNRVDTTTSTVNLNKTDNVVPNVFGGGNQAGVPNTYIYLNGANISNIFGGSNATGTVQKSNIETNSGTAENIYGGNNQGGETIETNIRINQGNIINIYGGGEQAQSTTSNINIYSGTIKNIYGGGNRAGVTTSNITANGGNIDNIFGGANISGTVNQSYVVTNDGTSTGTIKNVYGGNNQGGMTVKTDVTINGGGVVDAYGGGNQAVTEIPYIKIYGNVSGSVFGGGNQAEITTNTTVDINNGNVINNVYGGGNEGAVLGNTNVRVKNSTLQNSLYAGGNGSNAIVYGNTNLIMEGNNSVTKNVFGGGNKAATGDEKNHNSISTVNIVGGNIGGNVYGGANTSVVYGVTKTNIGYDAVNDTSLEIGDVEIVGTVFGGGEANEAGDENYDFSFISVTDGIDIQIDGNKHNKFSITGSIFGSGNASSTSGQSYITIKNYGTADNPQSNVSLQRANCATIINSAISLSGATDRTNEYSTTFFSISRVDEVKLKNNSILYMCNGANLLKKLDSLVDENGQEVKGKATIDEETGETQRNVDNRIYMLEGKNLNIATNEQVTAYGEVYGMFFFGLFTNRMNPSTSTGFYHQGYENGDTITNAGTFSSNSYAMAQHMVNHDTTIDGFYTNYNEDGKIRTKYIETTPKDDVYYMWLVGEKMDVTVFELSLAASKYATLGTYELLLQGFSDPNIKFSIAGFSAGLANGISLVDPSEIETIAPDEETADSVYGLTMETGNTGWQNKGKTNFLTENGGTYTGSNDYNADNSTYTPTLNFCLYHSQNISKKQALGDVRIRLQAMVPIDDLNYKVSYIDINITLSSALYQDDFFEAAITPGEKFGLFTTTETTITSKSNFSVYYSLYKEDFSNSDYYANYKNYNRVLVSRDENNTPYTFPENTKITMLDMVTNKYYYYIVTNEDVANNKYIYKLSDFIAMGSINQKFDEASACDGYYNQEQDLIYENYIFHVGFADSNISEEIKNKSLLMELRDSNNQTLLGVLGIQRDIIKYTVYPNQDATIKLNASIEPTTAYLGNQINLNVETKFNQTVVDSKTIYDTQYFDKKLGIKISIYDNDGNKLGIDSLLGINFELDGKKYYPRVDGTTRISIADKVTDVLVKLKINTMENSTLATRRLQNCYRIIWLI